MESLKTRIEKSLRHLKIREKAAYLGVSSNVIQKIQRGETAFRTGIRKQIQQKINIPDDCFTEVNRSGVKHKPLKHNVEKVTIKSNYSEELRRSYGLL